jgi:hypothetical protein
MGDPGYERYVHVNLPHARTIVQRVGRSLAALGAFPEEGQPDGALHDALTGLEASLREFDDDPPLALALAAADRAAVWGRALVDAIEATSARGDRLGQNVRNLFECLGLAAEGATLSLRCGEPADSPLR